MGYASIDNSLSNVDSKAIASSQGTISSKAGVGDSQIMNTNTASSTISHDIVTSKETVVLQDHAASATTNEKSPDTKLAWADTGRSSGSRTTVQDSFVSSTAASEESEGTALTSAVSYGNFFSSVRADIQNNSGAASTSIPIDVPAGRKNMAPQIALKYNSDKRNGWMGVGWTLELGAIYRNKRWGLNYNADDYVFAVDDSSLALARRGDWGANYFGAKTEKDFSKYFYNNVTRGWVVTARNGTKYYFGSTAASRQDDPADATKIFKWCLDRVEDTNGNYMTITYWKNQGEIYLDEIKYAGSTYGLPPTISVKFYSELRTDVYEVFSTFFSVKTAYRLKSIKVYGNAQLARTYELNYDYSLSTLRSLLSSVTLHGSEGNALLSTIFTYSSSSSSLYYNIWSHDNFGISPYGALRSGDFNGDNKSDMVFSFSFDFDNCRNDCRQDCEPDCESSCEITCENSCQNNYGSCTFDCNNDCEDFCEGECTDDYICDNVCRDEYDYDQCYEDCIGDPDQYDQEYYDCLNGCETWCEDSCDNACRDYYDSCRNACRENCEDSCIPTCESSCDYSCQESCGDYCSYYGMNDNAWVGISGNNSLAYSSWFQTGIETEPYGTLVGDFNGDGRNDIVFYNGYGSTWVGISDGSRFIYTIWSQTNLGDVGSRIRVGDFNGDGMSDVYFYASDNNQWVGISNGSSFIWNLWAIQGFGDVGSKIQVGDFNGDGISDLYFYSSDNNSWVGLSTGSTFTWQIWSQTGFGDVSERIRIGDFNGDGISDVYFYASGNNQWVGISNGSSFIWSIWSQAVFGDVSARIRVGDFNGDDKNDIVFYNEDGNTWVGISTGSAFNYSVWSQDSFGTKPYEIFNVGDFNGDGKSDIYFYYEDGNTWTGLSPSFGIPDLLKTVSNGFGGAATLEYLPSSAYNNCINADGVNVCLPFVTQTLSSVTISDGRGNSSATTYDYSGGYFDFEEREFRGFQYVKAKAPNGMSTETWFLQDDVFRGLPYERIKKDISGSIYIKFNSAYQLASPYPGVDFPYLIREDDYIYDGDNVSAPRHKINQLTYDNYGNITSKYQAEDPLHWNEKTEVTGYYYDLTNWIISLPEYTYSRDRYGDIKAQTWYEYYSDGTGNLWKKKKWLNTGSDLVTVYENYEFGNFQQARDPKGYTTEIIYNNATRAFPESIINHLGYAAIRTYHNSFVDKIETETDPDGNTTTYEYDEFSRMKKVTMPSPYGVTEYSYRNFGDPDNQNVREEIKDRNGALIQWKETYFDGLGRTVTERYGGPGARTIAIETEYNNQGLVSGKSLPYFEGDAVYKTTYTYDPSYRLIQTLNPDGTSAAINYMKGRITHIDANGHRKVAEKDIYGRIVKVEEYTGNSPSTYGLYATTVYDYDVLDNLIYVRDEYAHETYITYDSLSRKIEMEDPDMGYWTYGYDANGNLVSQKDAKNQVTTFEYDELNRPIKKNYPDGSFIEYRYDEIFSANPSGRLTTLIDFSGATQYYYDSLGHISRTDRVVDSTTYTTQTQYDALGRVKKLIYPDAAEVDYTYDGNGNIKEIKSDSQPYAFYSSYTASGKPVDVDYGIGTNTFYQYYPLNDRLFSITLINLTDALLNSAYYYDNAGNITRITDLLTGSRTRDFKYDDLDRLIEATSQSYGGTLLYRYDKIGNMMYNCKYGDYNYNDTNHRHAVTRVVKNGVATNYAYDANGNMTSGNGRTFTYDFDNMPTSIDSGSAYVESVYDAYGNRVKKTTPNSTTIYIERLYECVNGVCTKNIMSGNQMIAQVSSDGTYYYYTDHLGSSSIITDSAGNKDEDIYYYPYGEIKTNTGSINARYKFTGKEFDAESGLYYYGARYYDPKLARFTSADTIVPIPFYPQTYNRYAYAYNNPIVLRDLDGHEPEDYWDTWNYWYGSEDLFDTDLNDFIFSLLMGDSYPDIKFVSADLFDDFDPDNSSVSDLKKSDSAESRIRFAVNELENNSSDWAWWNWELELPHNKCNEFIYAAHGRSSSGFPTVLRDNEYFVPNIFNLADPDFAKKQLEYGDIGDRLPGDIVVWYSKPLEVHHGGLYIGNKQVIHATFEGLKMNTVDYITDKQQHVTPIIRRLR